MTLNTSLLNQLHHFRLADNHTEQKGPEEKERYEDREGEAQNE